MPARSQADYFKGQQGTLVGHFNVDIAHDKLEAFEELLYEKNTNKTLWLIQKINEELQNGGLPNGNTSHI